MNKVSPKSAAIALLVPLVFMTIAGATPVAADSCSSGTFTSISSNFNGTAIKGGNWIWFNAHIKLHSPPSDGLIIYFTQQTITSSYFNLAVPDGEIVFSSSASTASTNYFSSGGPTGGAYWLTTVPVSQGSDVFISALAFQVPSGGFPGGINPTVWGGCYSVSNSSNCAFGLQWQWGAAVYTSMPTNPDGSPDYNSMGVIAADGAGLHAGTPVNEERFVIGGARGGGGANYTGSWSGTAAVAASCFAPPCSSSTTSMLTVNSVALNGTAITGYEVDVFDCQGNFFATGFTPATFSLSSGLQYTVYPDQSFPPCTFDHWQDTGSSALGRTVTLTTDTTLTVVYNCG